MRSTKRERVIFLETLFDKIKERMLTRTFDPSDNLHIVIDTSLLPDGRPAFKLELIKCKQSFYAKQTPHVLAFNEFIEGKFGHRKDSDDEEQRAAA